MPDSVLFQSWSAILRVLILGPLTYLGLVATLRVAGKRTLAKMNAFDLVVTVALGSTLSSAIISQNVSLAQGLTAIVLLVLLQFVVAWAQVRLRWFERLTKSEPALLFHGGEFLRERMAAERVTESDMRQAMRSSGYAAPGEVGSIVLETDGSFSVLGKENSNMAAHDLIEPPPRMR